MPAGMPVRVYEAPVPVWVTPAGFRVRVHVPVAGRPLNATLPVDTVQVGWLIVPTTGVAGRGLTITVVTADCTLWQLFASVTLTQ